MDSIKKRQSNNANQDVRIIKSKQYLRLNKKVFFEGLLIGVILGVAVGIINYWLTCN
jgi:hypothetical protein